MKLDRRPHVTRHRSDNKQRPSALAFQNRSGGKTPRHRTREVGFNQFCDSLWITLQLALIFESPISKQENVKAPESLDNLNEVRGRITNRTIEEPRHRVTCASRFQIRCNAVQPRRVSPNKDEPGALASPNAGCCLSNRGTRAENDDTLRLPGH